MKKKEPNFDFYTLEEFSEIWSKGERLVFIDTGIDEVVGRYDDIPDIIVDTNLKMGSTDLTIYEFESGEKLLNTYGMFLDKCNPIAREGIIKRLVRLQRFEIEPKKYKLLTENTLQEFYEMCDAFIQDFDNPYTDEDLDLMERDYFSNHHTERDY